MPAMTMSGMPTPCAEAMGKPAPTKQAPGKSTGNFCPICIACAVNVGFSRGFSPIALYHGQIRVFSREANRNSFVTPPALPPPILRA